MPEEVKERAHRLARRNKFDRGIVFTDRENEPIDEDDDMDYDPNNDSTPEENTFDLDNYVPDKLPVGVNDGDNTYENPSFGDANYYTPLKEDEEHQYDNDKEPPDDVEGTNDGDDDDNHGKHT